MSDFDELDSLLGPLREPATPAELASEREIIDLMAKTHRHAKGTIMFSSRRARVATLIAAGVIGFGGVAAAGGGLGLNDSGSTPAVTPEVEVEEIEDVGEVEVEEVEEITTTTAAAAIEESDDDTFTDEIAKATLAAVAQETDDDVNNPDTVFNENDCLDGNHGKTVSAVARGELEIDDIEVRDAAHSDCGKTADDATKVDDDDDVEVEDDDDVEVDDDDDVEVDEGDDVEVDEDEDHSDEETGRGSKGGNGNGNGNGKSGSDD